MAAFIHKLNVSNQRGSMNFGNGGNLQDLKVSKTYSGSGGNSDATILNGRRQNDGGTLAGRAAEQRNRSFRRRRNR
ncbi:hypothetical protein [Ectobacillus ponti]|uniref:Uncharacterized protein n=1 Tax=Ectobacillus ponti TaxID=2961894 RepID=A0AA42BPF9_9BACI|nr:hypothetical protein [Ectobacillus ponti]MCP8967509.1 hypothetical protein [Ectobacillus ponti]